MILFPMPIRLAPLCICLIRGEWQHAEAEILRAIELDPKNSEAHHLYSYLLFVTQRPDKALEEQKQATELDPFARPWAMGHAYILLRQFDIAIKELRLINEIQPHNALVRFMLSQAYWLKGMWKEWNRNWNKACAS